jgi:hypothetical protein
MSSHRLLIAASPGIEAREWMRNHLGAVLAAAELQVTVVGKNQVLLSLLEEVGLHYETVAVGEKAGRKDLHKIVSNCDFLMLFWNGAEHTKLLFEARLQGKKMKVIPFETTTVVNRERGDEFDFYIGRGSMWGNPYPVGQQDGQYTREDAIEHFRCDFLKKLDSDAGFRKGLLGLKGYRLACFCKPLACHGDVIADYLNGLPPKDESGND